MPWIAINGDPAYEPEPNGTGMGINPDGSDPTEWQRAQRWAAERANVRRHLILSGYRLSASLRQLNQRMRNLRKGKS